MIGAQERGEFVKPLPVEALHRQCEHRLARLR